MPNHRFLVPVAPLLGLYVGKAIAAIKNHRAAWVLKTLALASILFELGMSLFLYRPLLVEFGQYTDGLIQAGRWIRQTTAPGASIAVVDAGAIAYYSERRTIDILGLNDEYIAHTPAKSDPAYVLSQTPGIIQLHIAFSPAGELAQPADQGTAYGIIRQAGFKECYTPDRNRPPGPFYPYLFFRRCQ